MTQDDDLLIGKIRTPADLSAVPGYQENVSFSKASGRRLESMITDYHFAKADEYPCGIHECRTPHMHGYLVRCSDGVLTNIGKDCGKRHLGIDFVRTRKAFRIRRQAISNLASIMSVREEIIHYKERLDLLLTVTEALNYCRKELREWLPEQHAKLIDMGKRRRNEIMRVRRMSKREAEAFFETNKASRKDYPHGRPTVEELVAVLDGCDFFSQSLGSLINKQVLPPIVKLTSMTDDEISQLRPKDLEQLHRDVNSATRLMNDCENLASSGMRFFSISNIQKLAHMGASPEDLMGFISALEELSVFQAP